jgi:hypothetical protein
VIVTKSNNQQQHSPRTYFFSSRYETQNIHVYVGPARQASQLSKNRPPLLSLKKKEPMTHPVAPHGLNVRLADAALVAEPGVECADPRKGVQGLSVDGIPRRIRAKVLPAQGAAVRVVRLFFFFFFFFFD